jgi:undecaprenyl-diphosphatase
VLLGSPTVVGWALIAGGIAILGIEKAAQPRHDLAVAELPLRTVIGIGFAQCLAMIPGVSRSGATIMGALAMGVCRKTAAEFSFFLAVPTMIGASTLELIDSSAAAPAGAASIGWGEIAVGFAVSFVVALVVIRAFVHYISRHGFAPFAWYRIVVGGAALLWLGMR